MSKICTKCGIEKEETYFNKDKSKKDGLYSSCKDCNREKQNENSKKTWIKTKDLEEYKEKRKILRKKHWEEFKEKESENHKKWVSENRNIRREHFKNFKIKHKDEIDYKIKNNLRSRTRLALLSQHQHKDNKMVYYLGCSIFEYKEYLKEHFKEGMSFDNYGEWHIDHIKPISLFDLTIKEEVYKAFHYTNTQPLWAIDNIRKNNRWIG